jgi:hypothetical protein
MEGKLNNDFDGLAESQKKTDAKIEQMQKVLERKRDALEQFKWNVNTNIKKSMGRKILRIQEYMNMKARAEEQRGEDSKLAQMMRKKFDLEEQRKSSAQRYSDIGKMAADAFGVTVMASTLGDIHKSLTNNPSKTLRLEPSFNENLRSNLTSGILEIKQNMEVDDETFKALKDTARQFNIKWQPTIDNKMLEAVLPNYINEDNIMFDLVFGSEITDEVELPVGFINGQYNEIACGYGGLDSMNFIHKIGYNLFPKKNHIRKFITSEKAFMTAYNKLINK